MDPNALNNTQLDKFYTNPEYALYCINKVSELCGDYSQWHSVVEPSSGNGSFYNQIPCKSKVGIDILPDCDNIIQQDFLTYYPTKPEKSQILVIGNPPFGKISSLAVNFFNHAAKWANVIAFILPRTFRKNSIQNRLNPLFHIVYDEDIPLTPCCFTPRMMAKCCFQIWKKTDIQRKKVVLPTKHKDWEFLAYGPKDEKGQPTPPLLADFAIRAYGGKIGEIRKKNLHELRPKSWHWIRSNVDIEKLCNTLLQLDFSSSLNTARQNSMGRAELVNLYIKFNNVNNNTQLSNKNEH